MQRNGLNVMAPKVILCLLLFVSVVSFATANLVDLTHKLSNVGMSYWPTHTRFRLQPVFRGSFGSIKWVASNSFVTSEHMGSHVDAPYHVYELGRKIDEIPLDELHGPAVIVNIKDKARRNRNAMVDKQDLLRWEATNGRIPEDAYILMNSGWGTYWGNQLKYLGSSNMTNNLSFPGFSVEATDWLLKERKSFRGLGVDTVSCDKGNSTALDVHVMLTAAQKLCIENVANIDNIPEQGAHLYVMPILIKEGTGAPIRLFAMVGEGMKSHCGNAYSNDLLTPISVLVTLVYRVVLRL